MHTASPGEYGFLSLMKKTLTNMRFVLQVINNTADTTNIVNM